MNDNNENLIDAKKLSLAEWLNYVNVPKKQRKHQIQDYQFATDEHLDEYLASIKSRTDKEIKYLISLFLIDGGHLGHDNSIRDSLLSLPTEERKNREERFLFYRRLIGFDQLNPPWPSILWIIDLLPAFPQQAINGLNAYFMTHCQYMPDGRIRGMSDARALIQAKYMQHYLPIKQTLLDLTPSDFELLTGYLYRKKGYEVTVTKRTRDGGFDVLAEKNSEREQERLLIECKRYEQNIGVKYVRQILGLLSLNYATKAVLVTSANFTRPAIIAAHKSKRLELINGTDFDAQMRKYVDYNWVLKTSSFIAQMKSEKVMPPLENSFR